MSEYIKISITDKRLAADPEVQAFVAEMERLLNHELLKAAVEFLATGSAVVRVLDE